MWLCSLFLVPLKADWDVCLRGRRSNSSCQKQIGGEPQGGVRGQWPVDCRGMIDGKGAEGGCSVWLPWTMKKISSDKRWLRVARQFCQHLMLFSHTRRGKREFRKGGREREREEKCVQQGAVLLRIFEFKDLDIIQRYLNAHHCKLKIKTHSYYVTHKKNNNFREHHLKKSMHTSCFHLCY